MTEIEQKTIQNLLKIKGETRGFALKDDFEYVAEKFGPEAIKTLEVSLKEMGAPFEYKNIKRLGFYPIGTEAIILLGIKRAFDFQDEDFIELGRAEAKKSFPIRLFMKYFFSLDVVCRYAPSMWQKYYNVGTLEAIKLDKKEKMLVLHLKDFSLHPYHCLVLRGYFMGVSEMVTGSSAQCVETKCMLKGEEIHEFVVNW